MIAGPCWLVWHAVAEFMPLSVWSSGEKEYQGHFPPVCRICTNTYHHPIIICLVSWYSIKHQFLLHSITAYRYTSLFLILDLQFMVTDPRYTAVWQQYIYHQTPYIIPHLLVENGVLSCHLSIYFLKVRAWWVDGQMRDQGNEFGIAFRAARGSGLTSDSSNDGFRKNR